MANRERGFTVYEVLITLLIVIPWMLNAQVKILDPVFNPDHIKIHQVGPPEEISGI